MPAPENPPLFTVTDVLHIKGPGLILLPGISWDETRMVRKGDPLILRKPSGEILETTVRDFPLIRRTHPNGDPVHTTLVALPKDIRKSDIPIGTEVFLRKAAGDS